MNEQLRKECRDNHKKAVYIGKQLPEAGKKYFNPKNSKFYECLLNEKKDHDKMALIQFENGKQEWIKEGLSSCEIEVIPIEDTEES